MTPTSENLWTLIENTKIVHQHERDLSIQSIDAIGLLEETKAAVRLGLTIDELCESINISVGSYWKRARVARLFRAFPATRGMLERGETELSSLAIIAAKITATNAVELLVAIKGKSKREVAALVSRIREDGSIGDDEGTFQLVLNLSKEEFEMFNRARQVIAHSGKNPNNKTVFAEMAKALLDRKDPMIKAERAAARAMKKSEATVSPGKSKVTPFDESQEADAGLSPGKPKMAPFATAEKPQRKPVPAAMKRAVLLRDEGQCTYQGKSGERCKERSMLELDHIVMVCRGGENSVENLTLKCRYHNNAAAVVELGSHYSK